MYLSARLYVWPNGALSLLHLITTGGHCSPKFPNSCILGARPFEEKASRESDSDLLIFCHVRYVHREKKVQNKQTKTKANRFCKWGNLRTHHSENGVAIVLLLSLLPVESQNVQVTPRNPSMLPPHLPTHTLPSSSPQLSSHCAFREQGTRKSVWRSWGSAWAGTAFRGPSPWRSPSTCCSSTWSPRYRLQERRDGQAYCCDWGVFNVRPVCVRALAFTQYVVDCFHPAEGLQRMVLLGGQVGDGKSVGFLRERTRHSCDC